VGQVGDALMGVSSQPIRRDSLELVQLQCGCFVP